MNLFKLAKQNSEFLEKEYDKLKFEFKTKNNLGFLEKIETELKDWQISINISVERLQSFLIYGKYKNIFEVKKDQNIRLIQENIKDIISEEEALKLKLKNFYYPRKCLTEEFESAEDFKYGAFNIGGIGVKKFGEFCIIINQELIINDYSSIALIKEDSLNYYENGKINIERLKNEISNKEFAHILAILKHKNDLIKENADNLALIVCNNKEYLEVIILDEIIPNHVNKIRISQYDYDYYTNLIYRDYCSENDKMDKIKLAIFEGIYKMLENYNILIELC